jgi:alpha-L-rhamnosidase
MSAKTKISPFVNSKWIWPDWPAWDLANSYALFRKTFSLDRVPARAPLFITADQSYRLYVNGCFVSRGPARGFQAHWPYDEVDIARYLVTGRNVIAVRAHNPGRSNFQYLTQGFAGLLVTAKWGAFKLASDESWKCLRQESVSHDTVQESLQLFNQEHVDLRLDPPGWFQPDFDDASWGKPSARVWDAAPWFSLEERGTALLAEREVKPVALLGAGAGISADGYRQTRDVVTLRYREDRTHRPAKQGFEPLEVPATDEGRFRSYLFDFGKTVVGNMSFEIEGAQGGEIIDTHYTETVDMATLTADLKIPTHCRVAFGGRLICRAGVNAHTFYHHEGFRYLVVTVRDSRTSLKIGLHLNWTGYPLERKGGFESSDGDLEKIWETCAWTQQCCSLDAYVDTPWREQAQWWGDARVQAWNTFHLNGDARLFRRGIAQIGSQTTPDHVTYGHAPTMAHECILPDFTLIWMLTIWDYYWQTGSTEALATHHEAVQKAFDYFRKMTDKRSGLAVYDDRYWLFLDWTNLFKDGAPTVYNLWLLIALEKLAQMYRVMRRTKDAAPLEAWAKKLRVSLGRLIDKDGLLRDGIDRKGKIVSETSIHSQTLALLAGLKGLNAKAAFERILLPFIRGESQPKALPSAYWVTYVFSILEDNGYAAEMLPFIKKYWLPMAAHGTTWENYQPRRGEESFSHAWSAHPLFHLVRTVGGIEQSAPAWKEIIFRPVFHGEQGRATVPTPQGSITSEWKREGNRLAVKLQLPKGVKARVELPGIKTRVIAKSGKWTCAV